LFQRNERKIRTFINKKKELMAKFNSARENFRKKERQIKADLEKASRIWNELAKRFKWWGSIP